MVRCLTSKERYRILFFTINLSGDAAKLISKHKSTDSNYEVEWLMLQERYEDTKALIKNYLQNIVDLSKMVKTFFGHLSNEFIERYNN